MSEVPKSNRLTKPGIAALAAIPGALILIVGGWYWLGRRREPSSGRPTDHWKAVAKARAYLDRGRPDLAFQTVSGIRDEAPGAAEALTIAARALLMRGQISVAKRALERSLKLRPEQADAAKMLAAIYLASGDGPRAVDLLQTAARLDPNDFRPWYALGKVYHELGDLAKSADAYAKALKRRLPAAEARESRIGLIRTLIEANHHDEAAAEIATALKLLPDDPELLGLAARQARDQGRADQALALAERALAADADNFDALLARAQVHNIAGRLPEALADVEHALRVNRNHLGALQLLVLVQTRMGLTEPAAESKERFRRASERVVLMDKLTREINRRPTDPEPRVRMGQAAVEGEMFTLAHQCFQAALDLDPNYQPARDALDALQASGRVAPGAPVGPTAR